MAAKYKLVLIEWVDSSFYPAGWHIIDKDTFREKTSSHKSVGFLIGNKKQAKTIVPHIVEADEYNEFQGAGAMTIPTSCIKKLTVLR